MKWNWCAKMKSFRTAEEVLEDKVIVSDTRRFTSSSASISCYDPRRNTIYTPYHASSTGFGEQASVFAIAEIPIPSIKTAENHVLLESDVEIQGGKYNWPIDSSALLLNGKVRVFFLANADCYYFFDWSQERHCIDGAISPVQCRVGDKTPVPLTSQDTLYCSRLTD